MLDLVKVYGNGDDERIQSLVLKLYHHLQTRADSGHWLESRIETFSAADPDQWRGWLDQAIDEWCREWTPLLEELRGANVKAAECLELLRGASSREALRKALAADGKENYPARKYTALREPLEDFFEEAAFLHSLIPSGKTDPLAEDWDWVRGHMKALLLLVKEFAGKFSERKQRDGLLDFHDLEQFALKLLWDFQADGPTAIASRWRDRLRFVFVDEYQDINAAQDRIIFALSRQGKAADRFLVGDIKQSIYRFRLADPTIFRRYADEWTGRAGRTIALSENFRSDASILDFVNALFAPLMRREVGGVDYDDRAKLIPGRKPRGDGLAGPRTELCLRIKGGRDERGEDDDGADEWVDLEESEKEARMLALRLKRLKEQGERVEGEETKALRPVEWRDMAVLLRSPSGKAEIFAKQFEQAGVPLTVARGGFFDSSEVADLLCLLRLLDNPLQDVPLIAVLRSPLVGLTLDQLAEVRMTGRGHFWFPLSRYAGPGADRVARFLERFGRWRKLARHGSLSHCLEEVLDETRYADWLKVQSRGPQRVANVERFVHLAEQFDQFQRQGLFRFLNFIEAQREAEAEPEIAASSGENAVRLMSIHQSKGLEFPVVAVADLGKDFNFQDLRSEIIVDETFGLCPRVKPPEAIGRYASLPYRLARKNQRREIAGEELRLLYVALTRARDRLVLAGTISDKEWDEIWSKPAAITTRNVVAAGSYADWLGRWFAGHTNGAGDRTGETALLRWNVLDDEALRLEGPGADDHLDPTDDGSAGSDAAQIERLQKVLAWRYGFEPATRRTAKSSVTALRREANDEAAEEAEPIFRPQRSTGVPGADAAEVGLAHHQFLQHFRLACDPDLAAFKAEAKRLVEENYLSAGQGEMLKLEDIVAFWGSAIGKKILSQAPAVRRELPFTAKFSPKELDGILGGGSSAGLEDEFIVVQGVADLAVLLPKEIWLVDFKTDDVAARDIADKVRMYRPQLQLYARALEKIYGRPVTNGWLHFLSARRTETI